MAPPTTSCLCIGFLLLWQSSRFGPAAAASGSSGCEIAFDRLDPLEPLQKVRSEAGTVEYFDDTDQQLSCGGVLSTRIVIDDQGLVLPGYGNGVTLAYAVQGRGYFGLSFPGCPGTSGRLTQGDVLAVPAGVPVWIYNDGGNTPLEIIMLVTIGGKANQLEPQHREFGLAGSDGNRTSVFTGLEHLAHFARPIVITTEVKKNGNM